jgi:TonB-linked SusC/RagA family outer membrane protein
MKEIHFLQEKQGIFIVIRKIFGIMKISLLFCLFILNLAAATVEAQNKVIEITTNELSLGQLIEEIERQTDFLFVYRNREIDADRIIHLDKRSDKVFDLLNKAFKGTNIGFEVENKYILLVLKDSPEGLSARQQVGKRITGLVTDQNGEPIAGANVVEKSTTNGTITDSEGNFTISVADNAVLQISYVGYITQEIIVGDKSAFNIVLQEDVEALDEVVVVGYGTQKRATVTGAVSSIVGKDFSIAPVTNASNALAGKIPGLITYQRSGEPGSDGTTIRIRGVNSLGNNEPLIVVDGVPGRSLERLDASTIENITVLKDASAAIYGSRAANGVILITTKRGRLGKPQINVTLNQGFNQPTVIPDMANAAEYATMLNEIDTYRGVSQRYTAEDIQKFADGSDPWKYPNTDFFAETFKTWSPQNALNASMSGGNDRVNYFVSVGSKFQDGYYKNSATFYKQYDFRSNLDAKINKDIKLGFDIAGRVENNNRPTRDADAIFRMLQRGKPNMPAYWPNGLPGPDIEYGDNPAIVATDATGYDRDKKYYFNSNVKLEINIPWVNGLSVTANGSYDKLFRFRKRFETPWYLYSWDGVSYENGEPLLIKGKKGYDDPRLREWMEDTQTLLLNALVNYEANIGVHGIKILAGSESIQGQGDNFNAYRRYFLSTSVDQMFAGGDQDKDNGGSGWESTRLNYFGRVNYNYAERILFEFVWRYDGSYIFPKGKRFGFFPGISAGWRISEEEFWKNNLSFIDRFKIRTSWGQTGNDRIDEWQYLATYAMNANGYTYIFGVDQENKLMSEARIPNPDVTWEVANQADLGFEGALMNNRLYFEFDVFDNRRSNILWVRNASVPNSTGLSLPSENIGKVKNQGVDYLVGFRDHIGDFVYDISFNGGYSRNKIIYWDEAPGRPDYQQSTGKPIPTNPSSSDNDLYYQAIGIFSDQAAIDSYPHWNGARPGDIIFQDVNEDGKIDGNDRVRSDKTNIPRFIGGFNAKLSYKQFDLSFLFQGASGAVAYIWTESGNDGNYLKSYYDDRWWSGNINSKGPRANISTAEYWHNRNTYFLYNTDYIRLKNMELGYNVPKTINRKLGVTDLRIYFSGYNLLTFSKLKDYDPEMSSERGRNYPAQRVLNMGVSLSF